MNQPAEVSEIGKKVAAAFRAGEGRECENILLNHMLPLIKAAGGVPSNHFKRALAAARALDRAANLPVPPPHPDEKDYRVTATNGREFTVHVYPKEDVFAACKRSGIEIASFVKI
jgi:hypothetical protein